MYCGWGQVQIQRNIRVVMLMVLVTRMAYVTLIVVAKLMVVMLVHVVVTLIVMVSKLVAELILVKGMAMEVLHDD